MRLRELWWEWNPRRLQRLLKISKGAVDANANLCSNYFNQMRTAEKNRHQAEQLTIVLSQRIEALEQELEARNGELHTLRKDTQ
jgi:hypothetical protein